MAHLRSRALRALGRTALRNLHGRHGMTAPHTRLYAGRLDWIVDWISAELRCSNFVSSFGCRCFARHRRSLPHRWERRRPLRFVSARPGIPSSGPSHAGKRTSALCKRLTSTWFAWASSPGPPWSPAKATSNSPGSTAPSRWPRSTASPSSSAHPQPRPRLGLRRNIPTPCASKKTAAAPSTAIASSSPAPARDIAFSLHASRARWPRATATIRTCSAGRSTTRSARPPSTASQSSSGTPGSRTSTATSRNLNRHWTTAYWSQTYDNFDEVPFHSRNENPALLLDYKHFVTDTWTSYVQNQIDAIRPLISTPPVHHDQHDALEQHLRSLHPAPESRPRGVGRLLPRRPSRPRAECARNMTWCAATSGVISG